MFRKLFKILLTIFAIYYSTAVYAVENNSNILQTADSLYEEKQFTESLELYELFLQTGNYTPRSLMRMALIKEGLGDYTYALYYLNLYYSKIPNKSILKKMDEMASYNNLKGYEYNDFVFFISLYHRFYNTILLLFLSASVLFLIYLYIKRRKNESLGLSPVLFIIILGLFYIFSNYNIIPKRGIIANKANLMSAPSAGADLIDYIDKGHRITIKNQTDIWCEVEWEGKTVYLRENNILFIKEAS